jgi:2-iminobutanoate/2-iminopropanoate deaminase
MIEFITDASNSSYSLAGIVTGSGKFIYVAGQVGFDENGVVVEGGVVAETDATFDNIEKVLKIVGADLSNVVRMGVFMTSLDGYADFGSVRKRRFPGGLPASTTVQVAGLLVGASIEIDAVAFLPEVQ